MSQSRNSESRITMPIITRGQQNTDAWKKAHIGKPTASNFHLILTPKELKLSDQRHKYKYRLVAERLMNEYLPTRAVTGERGYWLDRGIDMETHAIEAFERQHNMKIEPVSFVTTDDEKLGCSPDGLIAGTEEREAVEIKAPAPWTHVEYLLAKQQEKTWLEYRCQVQGQMLVGGFQVVHFYSFHPRMPPKYVPTIRDKGFQKVLKEALDVFCRELDEAEAHARKMGTFVPVEAL
jgi:hypothetical protein